MKSLFSLLLGLGVGIGLALLIGWVLFPMVTYDTGPEALRADYQDEYIRLVSLAYQVENDLDNARQRLEVLAPGSPTAPLVELAERWITVDKSERMVVPLVRLARDLDAETSTMLDYMQRGTP